MMIYILFGTVFRGLESKIIYIELPRKLQACHLLYVCYMESGRLLINLDSFSFPDIFVPK